MREPRNWKWMIPAMLFFVFFLVGYFMSELEGDLACMASLPFGFSLVMLWSAWKNYRVYFDMLETENYVICKKAETTTPETLIFEAARGMHPEAVRLLLQHRKKVWMIRQAPFDSREWADWVLFDAPQVHVDAVIYFLKNSNDSQMMSKRLLTDGSKKLDPTGMVTDREQYDLFSKLLSRWMMATQPFGQQPPNWIPPYNPETVAKSLGIWHEVYEGTKVEELKD